MHRQQPQLPAVRRHRDVGAPPLEGVSETQRRQVFVPFPDNPPPDGKSCRQMAQARPGPHTGPQLTQ